MIGIGSRVCVIPSTIKNKLDRELYGGEVGVIVDFSASAVTAPWLVWLRSIRAARWFSAESLEELNGQPIIEHRPTGSIYIKVDGE